MQSTINLIFLSQQLVPNLINCEPRYDIAQASDHLPIETTLFLQTLYQPETVKRCWKKLDKNKINQFLTDKVPNTEVYIKI